MDTSEAVGCGLPVMELLSTHHQYPHTCIHAHVHVSTILHTSIAETYISSLPDVCSVGCSCEGAVGCVLPVKHTHTSIMHTRCNCIFPPRSRLATLNRGIRMKCTEAMNTPGNRWS